MRNRKREFYTELRRSKELRKAILEHGAYHNSNIDRVCNSIKADTYYNDTEKLFIRTSMLRDHFRVKQIFLKELHLWKSDTVFLEWLRINDNKTYSKIMGLFDEYKI